MLSTRISLRTDSRGFLSMQYMIKTEDGQVCFVEYFVSNMFLIITITGLFGYYLKWHEDNSWYTVNLHCRDIGPLNEILHEKQNISRKKDKLIDGNFLLRLLICPGVYGYPRLQNKYI